MELTIGMWVRKFRKLGSDRYCWSSESCDGDDDTINIDSLPLNTRGIIKNAVINEGSGPPIKLYRVKFVNGIECWCAHKELILDPGVIKCLNSE